jgi:hypothetical protein
MDSEFQQIETHRKGVLDASTAGGGEFQVDGAVAKLDSGERRSEPL